MKFIDAIQTGKKIRSEFWGKNQHLDTTLFNDDMEPMIKRLFCQISTGLSWNEILGNWEVIQE